MKCIAPGLALLVASHAWAHEVALEIGHQEATVLRLTYSDGQPFVFETYELLLPGNDTPEQVGRTDRQGRAVFLTGAHPKWRLKAYSTDGHGVDQILNLPPREATGVCLANTAAAPQRGLLLATGAGILFGLFGLVQLFLRNSRR